MIWDLILVSVQQVRDEPGPAAGGNGDSAAPRGGAPARPTAAAATPVPAPAAGEPAPSAEKSSAAKKKRGGHLYEVDIVRIVTFAGVISVPHHGQR